MPACFAFVTAVSISWSVCSFFSRSRIFWLPLSIPNMRVRQWAFAMVGKSCMHDGVHAALAAPLDRDARCR